MNARRDFFKKLAIISCAALLFKVDSQAVEETLLKIDISNDQEYKSLVFIMLLGGNDSANMLVDYANKGYEEYASIRPKLKLEKEELIPLSRTKDKYAVHNKLDYIAELFETRKLAFVANVGTMVKPIKKDSLNSVIKPPHLYSHSTQKKHWHSMQPLELVKTGWGGRIAEALQMQGVENLPPIYGVGTDSLFLKANNIKAYILDKKGAITYNALSSQVREETYLDINNPDDQGHKLNDLITLYKKLLSNTVNKTNAIHNILESSNVDIQVEETTPSSDLEMKLLLIAKIINLRDEFGLKRQIFYVNMSGYDTHNDQIESHNLLYEDLNKSIKSFDTKIREINMHKKVLTFIGSDFGRTITTNETGTDHGWGGHYFVFGGAVRGGRIFGKMPSLKANSDDLTSKFRLIPTTSVEEYLYPICRWFGLSDENIKNIFPHYEALTNLEDENYTQKKLNFIRSSHIV